MRTTVGLPILFREREASLVEAIAAERGWKVIGVTIDDQFIVFYELVSIKPSKKGEYHEWRVQGMSALPETDQVLLAFLRSRFSSTT